MIRQETNKRTLINLLGGMKEETSFEDIEKQILLFFKSNKVNIVERTIEIRSPTTRKVIFMISIFIAILTIFGITEGFKLQHHDTVKYFDLISYCTWTIIPPIWFLFEYVWVFPKAAKLDPAQLADLKYTQELASKIWGGLVVLITALLYLKYGGNLLFGKTH